MTSAAHVAALVVVFFSGQGGSRAERQGLARLSGALPLTVEGQVGTVSPQPAAAQQRSPTLKATVVIVGQEPCASAFDDNYLLKLSLRVSVANGGLSDVLLGFTQDDLGSPSAATSLDSALRGEFSYHWNFDRFSDYRGPTGDALAVLPVGRTREANLTSSVFVGRGPRIDPLYLTPGNEYFLVLGLTVWTTDTRGGSSAVVAPLSLTLPPIRFTPPLSSSFRDCRRS